MRKYKKLGQILIEKGLINEPELEDALREQTRGQKQEFLGAILIRIGYIKENELLIALAEQFQIPILNLKHIYIDWNFVKRVNPSLVLEHKCFPIFKNDESVTFAITNPLDAWTFKEAEGETGGLDLQLVLVSHKDMEEIIQRYKEYMKNYLLEL